MVSNVSYVHTLGGSTLDNFAAVTSNTSAPDKNCITGRLQTLLGDGYEVVSHAQQGLTISSIPSLAIPGLRDHINAHQQSTHYVVISGGSDECGRAVEHGDIDIRAITGNYMRIVDTVKSMGVANIKPILVLEPLPHLSDQVKAELTQNGRKVVALHVLFFAAVAITATVIAMKVSLLFAAAFASAHLLFTFMAVKQCSSRKFVLLYIVKEACMGRDVAMATLKIYMNRFYLPILRKANQEQLPVCDLTNFNPQRATTVAQGSVQEGQRIAIVLTHIIERYRNTTLGWVHRYHPEAFVGSSHVTLTRTDPLEWEMARDPLWQTATT